jgi:DNA repair protein RecN (Recombination protein N)
MLADAEAHRDALGVAYEVLQDSAGDALGTAVAALGGRPPFAELEGRLRALQAEIAETAHDVRATADSVVADPQRLSEVQTRRALLREITRKYGATLADVSAYAVESGARLDDLEQHEARAIQMEADRLAAEARAGTAALSKARRAAAGPLGTAVTEHMRGLAMPAATFTVEVAPGERTDDGADDVVFLLAANSGEPARPLARAASGGELSRAMLALRLVLSEAPPTLVFDEVDAGIGGEAGAAVGRALATLGGHHQVLCVTHLAQVAAFADAHVSVTKEEAGGRTVARATLLLDDARVNEISRMLAGVERSTHARRHARELLHESRSSGT